MGIAVEFNPDLALRNYQEFKKGSRAREECIPEKLIMENIYSFLKKGQRNYWLEGEIPLLQTNGDGNLSRPLASIIILEATHFIKDKEVYTKGTYKIKEVYNPSEHKIHFEGMNKIKK
jgi:hypothetical protein